MKKLLTISFLLFISLFLTGCVKKTTEKKVQEELFSGSIMDLAGSGKNVKCTFSSDSEDGSSEGTIYVAGIKSRNDITVQAEKENETFESHTIIDGEYMYSWSNVSDQGTKMKLSELENQASDIETPSVEDLKSAYGEYKDLQNETNFKCKAWIPNSSQFDPPSDIEFIDMTEMMQNMQQQAEDMQEGLKGMCGTCNMMPTDAEKSECLTNLGCE